MEPELGLATGAFARVIHDLCEDLLMGAYGSGSMMCGVDADALSALLAEVDDPVLQAKVLRLAGAAAEADTHLAESEALVVAAARRHWRLGDVALPARAQEPSAQAVLQPA